MTSPVTASTRLAWADVAKGACILLVVLHHTVVKHHLPMVPDHLAPVAHGWEWLTAALKPVRMPLFFLLAGVFAAGAVRRPWPQVLTKRVLTPYWVYVVWLGIGGVVFTLERTMVTNRVQDAGELVADLVFASTGAWFLYALAVYFVLVKLSIRVDVRTVLGVAALVAVSVSFLPLAAANREAVLVHFVYFALGARVPEVAHLLTRMRLGAPVLVAGVAAYAGGAVLLGALSTPLSVEITLLSLLGVPLAVQVASAATSTGPVSRGLAALGRRTLPVYVLHMPLLAALHHAPGLSLDVGGGAGAVLAVAYPVLATALITAAALLLHRLLVSCGLGPLFTLPDTLRPEDHTLAAAGARLRVGTRAVRGRLTLPGTINT